MVKVDNTRAFSSILSSKRQHITTMAAPICAQVRRRLKAMRYTVIELFLVGIGFRVRLADAFGNNLCIAILVTKILAVLALHSSRILEKFTA